MSVYGRRSLSSTRSAGSGTSAAWRALTADYLDQSPEKDNPSIHEPKPQPEGSEAPDGVIPSQKEGMACNKDELKVDAVDGGKRSFSSRAAGITGMDHFSFPTRKHRKVDTPPSGKTKKSSSSIHSSRSGDGLKQTRLGFFASPPSSSSSSSSSAVSDTSTFPETNFGPSKKKKKETSILRSRRSRRRSRSPSSSPPIPTNSEKNVFSQIFSSSSSSPSSSSSDSEAENPSMHSRMKGRSTGMRQMRFDLRSLGGKQRNSQICRHCRMMYSPFEPQGHLHLLLFTFTSFPVFRL